MLSTLETLPSEKQPLSMYPSYKGYNCITFSQQHSPKKNFFNLLNNGIIYLLSWLQTLEKTEGTIKNWPFQRHRQQFNSFI